MQWTGHPYLLCEDITDAVRQMLPLARNKGLPLHFDSTGLKAVAREDSRAVRTLVERLLTAAISLTRRGTVTCVVDAQPEGLADCRLEILVTDTSGGPARWPHDGPAEPATTPAVAQAVASLEAVRMLAKAIGGQFDYDHSAEAGTRARVSLLVPCYAPLDESVPPVVDGAVAWLVGQQEFTLEMAAPRLQRLGWRTRCFVDAVQAEAALAAGKAERPLLVVGSEWDGVTLGDMVWLRQALPGAPEDPPLVFLGVDAASETARTSTVQGIFVQVLPFSARQIEHVTALARAVQPAHA
jgi:hypothetical protein